jgi:3-deoxy-7-phosphoheptulonate synthase
MAEGLRQSRRLLLGIAEMGMPSATEVLDIAAPLYLSDLLTCAGIGARTTESQPHRALASGLPCPVGFKNGTDGGLQIALDALLSAHAAHSYIGMDEAGRCRVIHTNGNPDTCLVLRGGKNATGYIGNYDEASLRNAQAEMEKRGFRPNLVVDCSHANSAYNPQNQGTVCDTVAQARRNGLHSLVSIMLESNLTEGKQSLPAVLSPGIAATLRPDVSVTDACLGWDETEEILLRLARTV